MSSEDQDNLPQGEESIKRGRKPKDEISIDDRLKAAEERIFNLEQALFRISHVTGSVQFCQEYNIKKVVK